MAEVEIFIHKHLPCGKSQYLTIRTRQLDTHQNIAVCSYWDTDWTTEEQAGLLSPHAFYSLRTSGVGLGGICPSFQTARASS
jgi:hypothetical protein